VKDAATFSFSGLRPRRHQALLGGTVDFSDCLCALRHLIDPRDLIDGDAIAEYEGAFARTAGVSAGISFCSGRVGFYGLLLALGVGPGDEVLLQVPTHIVVANAIRYTGARPVYVDCLPHSYNIDLADARRKVTSRTKVLLLQHTFGVPAQIDAAQALAEKHGLVLIEDCVHALGASYRGSPVGSFGRAAFFSTEETKTISTTLGGMVVTDDLLLARKVRHFQHSCPEPAPAQAASYLLKLMMYYFLAHPAVHYYSRGVYEFLGRRVPLPRPTVKDELVGRKPLRYEQKLSNAQAALGIRQLEKLSANIAHRREIAAIYARGLSALGYSVPAVPEEAEAAFVRFPVPVADRLAMVRHAAPTLLLGTWFTSVLEEAVIPQYGDYQRGTCPIAEAAARHLVNLPTHPRVTPDDARRFVALFGQVADTQAVDADALLGVEKEMAPERAYAPEAGDFAADFPSVP